MDLARSSFGRDFSWGVSTAAFQIEGGWDADGKGLSIWDVFTDSKKRVKGGTNARTACDFYNCPARDIDLVEQLHIPNFRLSLSWPRIFPSGTRPVNLKGIAFYDRVVDELLERNIAPWVTLYHWDLPQALELKGGWTNRDIVNWFADYADFCARHLGDRVQNWMVMNEPSVFTGAGYFLGIHAPGKRGLPNFLKAMHHSVLATASAARILKQRLPGAAIGTTLSCTLIEPASSKPRDVAAANRVNALLNRSFVEPILGMGYPIQDLSVLENIRRYMIAGDDQLMAFDFDFIGLQCYTREIVKFSLFTPYVRAKILSAAKRGVPFTQMGWEIYPESLYKLLKQFSAYPNLPKIIVTENGAAFRDTVSDAKVLDYERTDYLKQHLAQLHRAKSEGVNVQGYFVWTLADNFEWAEGYEARFGLVHVDFESQQRTVKDSGLWYSEFLNGNARI